MIQIFVLRERESAKISISCTNDLKLLRAKQSNRVSEDFLQLLCRLSLVTGMRLRLLLKQRISESLPELKKVYVCKCETTIANPSASSTRRLQNEKRRGICQRRLRVGDSCSAWYRAGSLLRLEIASQSSVSTGKEDEAAASTRRESTSNIVHNLRSRNRPAT